MNDIHPANCVCEDCQEWRAYGWWRDWDWLWGQIGLAEKEWATLYLPFMRPNNSMAECLPYKENVGSSSLS